MRLAILLGFLLSVLTAIHLFAAEQIGDTLKVSQVSPKTLQKTDSLKTTTLTKPDSATNASKSRSDSVLVVKHEFNHREQIITGSVVMSCLVLMLVAMNNYNPR